ncbi:hypothetical protein [Billgrantia kenyensis]|nr:hypothetical protein [Halomonas kenyensis]
MRFKAGFDELDAAYAAADAALYQVKARGRDGWAVAELKMSGVHD